MRKSITIELKYEGDTDTTNRVMRQAARDAAKILFTQAILVSSGRQPQIAVQSEDYFDGTEQIDIQVDESEGAEDG